ncbi:MAG: fluoride efflux transporter CrcB [Solirubrobacteraceae bacterium]
MSIWTWIGVALLGGVGACARFAVVSLVAALSGGDLPLGVLAVNVSGSLLLGVLAGASAGGDLLVLCGAATLGSYTTFSTWVFETQRLAEANRVRAALANVVVSLVLGVGAAALGRVLGAWLF